MTWADFYLICFATGFGFSFLSFVLGGSRTGRIHLPHSHGHAGGAHLPPAHGRLMPGAVTPAQNPAAALATHVTSGAMAGAAHQAGVHATQGSAVSPFNLVTVTAFLAWFGGTGYLLTRYSGLWVGFALMVSVISGLIGGGIVFLFLTKVLISHEENMDPADYEMVGVLGRVCSSIRTGGTGEIIYSQVGSRRVCGARSEDSSAIAKGSEVVVTRYEKGIAYVRLWSELSGEDRESPSAGETDR
jgi:hypothetical protein